MSLVHVVGAHGEGAFGRFARHGRGFGQDVVNALAVREPVFEFGRFRLERVVRERCNRRLFRVDQFDDRAEPFQFPVVFRAEDFCEH